MEFSTHEYWSGVPCPPPGNLPNPGIKLVSPASQVDSCRLSHQEWKVNSLWNSTKALFYFYEPRLKNLKLKKRRNKKGFRERVCSRFQVMKRIFKSSLNCPPSTRKAPMSTQSWRLWRGRLSLLSGAESFSRGFPHPPAICYFELRLSKRYAWISKYRHVQWWAERFNCYGGESKLLF